MVFRDETKAPLFAIPPVAKKSTGKECYCLFAVYLLFIRHPFVVHRRHFFFPSNHLVLINKAKTHFIS